MIRSRRLVAFAVLLALSACVTWMPRRRNPGPTSGIPGGDGRSIPGATTQGRETGLGRKVVRGKREPTTLIADDKTECIVPEPKWQETSIGEKVTCEWRSP